MRDGVEENAQQAPLTARAPRRGLAKPPAAILLTGGRQQPANPRGWLRRLRFREVKTLAQGLTAGMESGQSDPHQPGCPQEKALVKLPFWRQL